MEYRLSDQKYTEAEYLFQTIEMAKSDEEYEVELCNTPPLSAGILNLHKVQEESAVCAYRLVTRRRARRRYTVNGSQVSPPAPPSTPTSLTAGSTPIPSPTATNSANDDDDRLKSLLYILDYAPKYKKKLKEQQRTDAELAELFSVVTITGSSVDGGGGGAGASSTDRISANSHAIRKQKHTAKTFKIHRSLEKEFFRDPDEEDSVSAPEYEVEEEDTLYRPRIVRRASRWRETRRRRRFEKFKHQENMEAISSIFDATMSFNEA